MALIGVGHYDPEGALAQQRQDGSDDGNGKSHYVAEGTWRLVGSGEEMGNVMSPQIRSVAAPPATIRICRESPLEHP